MNEYQLKVIEFLKQAIKKEYGNFVTKEELYTRYKAWSRQECVYTLAPAQFSMMVYRYISAATPKDARDTVTRKRVWRNVMFAEAPPLETIQ